eukprot:12740571-Prorocentrum_lima.AAC.1
MPLVGLMNKRPPVRHVDEAPGMFRIACLFLCGVCAKGLSLYCTAKGSLDRQRTTSRRWQQ